MYCTKCGEYNNQGSKFCKHCGANFDKNVVNDEEKKSEEKQIQNHKETNTHKKTKKPVHVKIIAIIIFVILFIGICSYGAYYAYHSITIPAKNRSIGENIQVSGDKVPFFIKATPVNDNTVPLKGSQSLGSTVDISPGGSLVSPITLTFKLSHSVKKGDIVVLATRENANDPWTYVNPTISPDGEYATVTTDHLSIWKPIQVLINFAENFKNEFINNLTGDYTETAGKPSCEDESGARGDNYQITSTNSDTLYWCFGEENGERILKVVNRKRYPLDLIHPGLTVISAGHITANLEQIARLGSGNHTVLFPHDEADFKVNLANGYYAYTKSSYSLTSGEAVTLDALQTALNALLTIIPAGGEGKVLAETATYKSMDKALQAKDCYNAVVNRNLADVIIDCIKPAVTATGPQAYVLDAVSTIGSLANWFASAVSGNVDSITNKADYTITITHGSTSPSQLGVNLPDTISSNAATMYNAKPDPNGISYTKNQDGCPIGKPIVKINSVSEINIQNYDPGKEYTYVITGIFTNPTSYDIEMDQIAFNYGNYDPNNAPNYVGGSWYPGDLDPNSGFVMDVAGSDMELSNKSNIVNAFSTEAFKAKYFADYDTTKNGPYPTVLIPNLEFPYENSERPMAHWKWNGENNDTISGKCDPNYYNNNYLW